MKERSIQKQSAKLAARYLVSSGEGFRLRDFDPADTAHFKSKQHAGELLESGIEQLRHLQEKLYAANSWSLLIILQAMDAGGKDGVISHVMSGVNPQGCEVHAFKVPSAEELSHDFLWRAHAHTPERGRIGIFNRSYYEDVLVVRVHPELLRSVRIPKKMLTNDIWVERYKDINAFERLLAQSGVVTLKFFLHLSKKEQRKRFLERLDDAKKHWKFSANDLKERAYWKAYQKAYEEMIQHTATKQAPWYVVPADNKWFTRLVVASAIVAALDDLDLKLPELDEAQRKEMAAARRALLHGKD